MGENKMKLEKLRKDWYYKKNTLIKREHTTYDLYDKDKDYIKTFKTKKEMIDWVKENKYNYQKPKTERIDLNLLFNGYKVGR